MILSAKIHGQVQGTVCRLIVEGKRIKNTEVSPGKVQIEQELSGDPEDDERGPDRHTAICMSSLCRLWGDLRSVLIYCWHDSMSETVSTNFTLCQRSFAVLHHSRSLELRRFHLGQCLVMLIWLGWWWSHAGQKERMNGHPPIPIRVRLIWYDIHGYISCQASGTGGGQMGDEIMAIKANWIC